jgi:hypothetical protein
MKRLVDVGADEKRNSQVEIQVVNEFKTLADKLNFK